MNEALSNSVADTRRSTRRPRALEYRERFAPGCAPVVFLAESLIETDEWNQDHLRPQKNPARSASSSRKTSPIIKESILIDELRQDVAHAIEANEPSKKPLQETASENAGERSAAGGVPARVSSIPIAIAIRRDSDRFHNSSMRCGSLLVQLAIRRVYDPTPVERFPRGTFECASVEFREKADI